MNEVIMLHIIFFIIQLLQFLFSFWTDDSTHFSHFPIPRSNPSPYSRTFVLFFKIYSVLLPLKKIFISKYFLFSLTSHTPCTAEHSRLSSAESFLQTNTRCRGRERQHKQGKEHGKISLRHTKITANSYNDVFTVSLLLFRLHCWRFSRFLILSQPNSTSFIIISLPQPSAPAPFKLTVLSQKPYANFLMLPLTLYA